jgi:hypothetical protein
VINIGEKYNEYAPGRSDKIAEKISRAGFLVEIESCDIEGLKPANIDMKLATESLK